MIKKLSPSLILVVSLLGLLSVINTGCIAVAAGAGAGAVAYVHRDLETTLSFDLEKTTKAAVEAIGNLKFTKVSEKQDALQAELIARTAQDRRIEIRLTAVDKKSTLVKIRVGVFGEERTSQAILEAIKDNL